MKKIFRFDLFILSVMITFAAGVLFFDIPRTDDIPARVITGGELLTLSDMRDLDGDESAVSFGDSGSAYGEVDLTGGDCLIVEFVADNRGETAVQIFADLYAPDGSYDLPYVEKYFTIPTGISTLTAQLPFGRQSHPDKALLRFFGGEKVELRRVSVHYAEKTVDSSAMVKVLTAADGIVFLISAAYLIGFLVVNRSGAKALLPEKKTLLKGIALYGGVILTVTGIFCVLFRNMDFTLPLCFDGGDEDGVFYVVKVIKESGTTLVNHRAGGEWGADMFDYPYSDKFSFIIVKLISYFCDNVYLITNIFYFTSYLMVGVVTCRVCRCLGYSRTASFTAAVLYAFSPYIQMRYAHMWLTPYYMLPVACLIAIRIINDEIEPKSRRRDIYILLSFCCGFTGFYYAWFACAMFAVAIVVKMLSLKKEDIIGGLKHCIYIFSCVFGVAVNIIPNMLYGMIHGPSGSSELAERSPLECEDFGLRIVQMVLPRPDHRIKLLSEATAFYNRAASFINESRTAAIGVVASVGLMIALLNIFSKKQTWSESRLILGALLIGTIGGLSSVIAMLAAPIVFLPVRSYTRLCLVIMFLSLLIVCRGIDGLGKKAGAAAKIAALGILAVGIFDQTITFPSYDYAEVYATRKFVDMVEDMMSPGDMIFVLPYRRWPSDGGYKDHMGYLESDTLIWSYGAAQSREESDWQGATALTQYSDMVPLLVEAGYKGLYLDYGLFGGGDIAVRLTEIIGSEPLISDDGCLYFWKLPPVVASNGTPPVQ